MVKTVSGSKTGRESKTKISYGSSKKKIAGNKIAGKSGKRADFKFYVIPAAIFAAVLLLDQLTKAIFQYKNFVVIKSLLWIKYSQNDGVIFGWFSGSIIFTVLFPLLMILFFIYVFFREAKKHLLLRIGFPLITAGLLGNLVDRFLRGFVTDFILIPIVPERNISNFNIADASLISGVVLVVVYLIWLEGKVKEK